MAVRVDDSMSLVLEVLMQDPNTGKDYTKKVTLNGINQQLTDDQYLEVTQKINGLLKTPVVSVGLITKQQLIPGNIN